MQSAQEILKQHLIELERQKSIINHDIEATNIALEAIDSGHHADERSASSLNIPKIQKMTVRDVIMEALKNGRYMPSDMLAFATKELGMAISKNSINTQLNRMKKAGLVAHNGQHWILPDDPSVQKNSPSNVTASEGLDRVEETHSSTNLI